MANSANDKLIVTNKDKEQFSSIKRKKRYWSTQELITLGVFAATSKIVSLVIALAGGGPNPITLILKNLVFTSLLVIMLYKVRKFGTLTLYMLVANLVSFLMLGGGITTIPSSMLAGFLGELIVLIIGGTNRIWAPVLAVAAYDLISKVMSLFISYLFMRESPGILVMVTVFVVIGYIGSLIGLYTGVIASRELKHAGIIRTN